MIAGPYASAKDDCTEQQEKVHSGHRRALLYKGTTPGEAYGEKHSEEHDMP